MKTTLEAILKKIKPVDPNFETPLRKHLDNLTKPRGSLGRLEDIAVQYISVTEEKKSKLRKKRIYVFAGDHGIMDQGVSAYPKEVTYQMVLNFLRGGAAINVLSRHINAELFVVDMGVTGKFDASNQLIIHKIREGTDDFTQGPAMTREECITAVECGIALALKSAEDGVDILGAGDMGIGNTTPSAAMFAALIDVAPQTITGRGTGIDDQTLENKISVIERGLKQNHDLLGTPLGVLQAVGGFEIAAITGLFIGAAACRIPVVVDGFISSAAALAAICIKREIQQYMFFSHQSAEQGHAIFYKDLGVKPLLDLELRLGEGTGGALAMSLIDASLKLFSEMATFEGAGVSDKENE